MRVKLTLLANWSKATLPLNYNHAVAGLIYRTLGNASEEFAAMLRFYQEQLRASRLQYVIFGHIGDNHVHVNIMPRDEREAAAARDLYLQFVKRAIESGGTISAEHGIGKLKRDYLRLLYTEESLREMAALKHAFDPAGILGRGNIFSEEFLKQ